MNEQLEKKLVESLDYIGTIVKSGVDLTKSQCPELLKELIRYRLVVNSIGTVVSGLFLSFFTWLIFYGYNLPKETYYASDPTVSGATILYVVVGVIGFFVSLSFIVPYIKEIIKIKLATKVFVLEYLSNIVGTGNSDE